MATPAASAAIKVVKHRDITYTLTSSASSASAATSSQSQADPKQRLDLYVASTDTSSSSTTLLRPLLIYIHGGLWVDRDKSDYDALAQHWCSTLGYHVAVVNYRQSRSQQKDDTTQPVDAILHPQHTHDTYTALAWLAREENQKQYAFSTHDFILVGHSCGAHIAGLIALAEPHATRVPDLEEKIVSDAEALIHSSAVASVSSASSSATAAATTASSSSSPSSPSSYSHALSLLRGLIGIEGIYDNYGFTLDFPSWSQGIIDAFTKDQVKWESPQDYLPCVEGVVEESPSRMYAQSILTASSTAPPKRRTIVPWLVIHSTEDAWVKMTQATRFHEGLLKAAASSSASSASASSSTATSSSTTIPASTLLIISGGHFEVVEAVGKGVTDELTKPIDAFVKRVCGGRGESGR